MNRLATLVLTLMILAACASAPRSSGVNDRLGGLSAPATTLTENPDGSRTLRNPELGFSLWLPEGTQEIPGGAQGEIIHAYLLGEPPAEFVTISVQRLGGPIGKAEPGPDELPPGFTVRRHPWQEHQILGMRMVQETEAGLFVDHAARVPLEGEAIALHVVGPAGFEEAFEGLLPALLEGLEGQSSW